MLAHWPSRSKRRAGPLPRGIKSLILLSRWVPRLELPVQPLRISEASSAIFARETTDDELWATLGYASTNGQRDQTELPNRTTKQNYQTRRHQYQKHRSESCSKHSCSDLCCSWPLLARFSPAARFLLAARHWGANPRIECSTALTVRRGSMCGKRHRTRTVGLAAVITRTGNSTTATIRTTHSGPASSRHTPCAVRLAVASSD